MALPPPPSPRPLRRTRPRHSYSIKPRPCSHKPTKRSTTTTWRPIKPTSSRPGRWCSRAETCSSRGSFVASCFLQQLGQRCQVLTEGDLVTGLFVGQLDLSTAQVLDDLVVDCSSAAIGALGQALPEAVDVAAELAELVGKFGAD